MACSSQASFSRHSNRNCARIIYCHCGLISPLKTSWTRTNPGRRFCGCANFSTNSCGFLLWEDDKLLEHYQTLMWNLMKELKEHRGQGTIAIERWKHSSIMFCTNGILLRLLISRGTNMSKGKDTKKSKRDILSRITHVIVSFSYEVFQVLILLHPPDPNVSSDPPQEAGMDVKTHRIWVQNIMAQDWSSIAQ